MGKVDTTVITCDSCGKDISPAITNYPKNYILKLSALNVAQHTEGSVIYSIQLYPPIDNDMYFCDLQCLKDNMNNLKGLK
jgi:hypothetical protein